MLGGGGLPCVGADVGRRKAEEDEEGSPLMPRGARDMLPVVVDVLAGS